MSFKDLFNKIKKDELLSLDKNIIVCNFRSVVLQFQAIQNNGYEIAKIN